MVRFIKRLGLFLLALAFSFYAESGWSQDGAKVTRVMVRAVSRDAKVIGTKVGGAKITIKDAKTGEVLAQGMQMGGTGNTRKIIIEPHVRGESIYDTPGTAGFLAELKLTRPTVIEVTAEGPMAFPQARQRASKTLLVVPGQDILGDGVVLEIHGFIVQILDPGENTQLPSGKEIPVRATVNMA